MLILHIIYCSENELTLFRPSKVVQGYERRNRKLDWRILVMSKNEWIEFHEGSFSDACVMV